MRRIYTSDEKTAALHLVREVGVGEAARRLGISKYTLTDWKMKTKAFAYSRFVGTQRPLEDGERDELLAQLLHEQQIEMRFPDRARFRHDPVGGSTLTEEPLNVLLTRSGVVHRHLVEWLDPTFDEVAERLAA